MITKKQAQEAIKLAVLVGGMKVGHLCRHNIDEFTGSKFLDKARKCLDLQCECFLINKELFENILRVSHCVTDFINRFVNIQAALGMYEDERHFLPGKFDLKLADCDLDEEEDDEDDDEIN